MKISDAVIYQEYKQLKTLRKMGKSIIRDARSKDLIYVAKIHKELFSDHYLGQFSVKIIKNFYSGFINNDIIFLVSETNGVINGFVLGGQRKEINLSNSSFIKKYIPLYTLEIIFSPHTWRVSFGKLIKILFQNKSSEVSLDYKKDYTLLSIGVSRLYQGKDIAKLLISEFNLRMMNFTTEYSLSVKDANLQAIRFYEKHGFVIAGKSNGLIRLIKQL